MSNRKDNIDVGDIIMTRYSGYHRVVKVETTVYNTWTAIRVTFIKVADKYGQPVKGKAEREASMDWCEKVTRDTILDDFKTAIEFAESKRDSLLSIPGV